MDPSTAPAGVVCTLSLARDAADAAAETAAQLQGRPVRGGIISWAGHAGASVREALAARLPGVPFVGGSSSVAGSGAQAASLALAGFWLVGEGLSFGAASAAGADPAEAAARAAQQALASASLKPFQARFAFLRCAPGDEEAALAGLGRVVPARAAILGATPGPECGPQLCSHDSLAGPTVAVALCDWPWRLGAAIAAPHAPRGPAGVATCTRGRTLSAIDGRPAAAVLEQWGGGRPPQAHDGIASALALTALGIARGPGLRVLQLADAGDRDGGLRLRASAAEGDRLQLVAADAAAVRALPARLAQECARHAGSEAVAGALLFVSGDLLAESGVAAGELAGHLARALGAPVSVAASWGEQGCLEGRRAEHTNLSACALVLTLAKDREDG